MRFALFIVLNMILFLRPADLVPDLENVPFYEVVMGACLALSARPIVALLAGRSLAACPPTVCILGMLVTAIVSHLPSLDVHNAKESGILVAKAVAYYLVLLASIDTPIRLDRMLKCLGLLIFCLAGLCVLDYHNVIEVSAVTPYMEKQDADENGERIVLARLRGAGLFNDPNYLCVILSIGAAACLYGFEDRKSGKVRFAWLLPIGLFAYSMALTHSRGGLMAALGSGLIYAVARFGAYQVAPYIVLGLPVVGAAYGGRQTSLDTSTGTGQDRIQLWSMALDYFRLNPVFGIGHGKFAEPAGLATHNTFLQFFAEQGLIGGAVFLSAFGYLLATLSRLRGRSFLAPATLRRQRPAMLMIVSGHAIGLMSLSRGDAVPTYLVIGIAAAYLRLVAQSSHMLVPGLSGQMVCRFAALTFGYLGIMFVFITASARWSH
jgi:putative inorganic carbon (hco3(-)) transporter